MDFRATGIDPAAIFSRPTADSIWLGPTQQSALSRLAEPAPVCRLRGGRASGRTLLLSRLRHELVTSHAAACLMLDASVRTEAAMLAVLLRQLGANAGELGTLDRRNLLTLLLEERGRSGTRVLILVDDYDLLADVAKSELGRLAALANAASAMLELRFAVRDAARPPLARDAARSEIPELHLARLDPADVEAYVDWRLAARGLEGLFTPTALGLVSRLSGGSFRAVDTLCRMTLLLLIRSRFHCADIRMVEDAAELLAQTRAARKHAAHAPKAFPEAIAPDAGERDPIGWLTVTLKGARHASHELQPRLLVGRAPSNHVCLPGATVDRFHAMIQATDDGVSLLGLNGTGGLLLNGRPVREALLDDADVVTIGEYELEITLASPVPARVSNDTAPGLADTIVLPPARDGRHLRLVK